MEDLLYKNCISFTIFGKEINLISEDTGNGYNTTAEIEDKFYFIGDEAPVFLSAVFAWEEFHGRDLTIDELHQAMIDNKLMSDAV